MLLSTIMAALARCGRRVRGCAVECFRDLASTLKGYCRDKTLGNVDTSYSDSDRVMQGCYADSVEYVPSGYTAVSAMLRCVRLTEDDVFVDYGCGKGRVLFAVAGHPLRKVVGIEVDETLFNIACANRARFGRVNGVSTPIEILHLDVTAFDPKEGTIFYMFNPFGGQTMQHILDSIRASLITHPRDIRVLYNNPKQRAVLDTQNWLLPEGEIENSRVYMWRNKPVLESHPCDNTKRGCAAL